MIDAVGKLMFAVFLAGIVGLGDLEDIARHDLQATYPNVADQQNKYYLSLLPAIGKDQEDLRTAIKARGCLE